MPPEAGVSTFPFALLAQDAAGGGQPGGAPNPVQGAPDPTAGGSAPPRSVCGDPSFLLLMVLMWGVFYFLVIRPQRKQEKARKALLESLKAGDKVRTRGGIVARVAKVKDNLVFVRVGDEKQIEIPIERTYVDEVITDAPAKDKA